MNGTKCSGSNDASQFFLRHRRHVDAVYCRQNISDPTQQTCDWLRETLTHFAQTTEMGTVTTGFNATLTNRPFLPRNAMLARYMLSSCVCLFVRLSVRPSQASTVPKRLNVGSRKTTPHYSPGTLVFCCQRPRRNFQRGPHNT